MTPQTITITLKPYDNEDPRRVEARTRRVVDRARSIVEQLDPCFQEGTISLNDNVVAERQFGKWT